MLEIRNLCKNYESVRAVDGVSMDVPAGAIVGLIGPNGSGKSTLLSLVAGTQRADSGSIRVDGEEISHLPPHQIFQRGVVRSFQDPSLFFRMSALDNALLPAHPQRGENPLAAPWTRLWRKQEQSHTDDVLRIFDHLKLRHQFDKPAADLSGGQMKLLEIGRAMAGEPKMLLLDEPTAGVAPALAHDIFAEIANLRTQHGLTILVVEHRLEILFAFVDFLYVLHLGKVIATGTPAEISANALVKEVYFGE